MIFEPKDADCHFCQSPGCLPSPRDCGRESNSRLEDHGSFSLLSALDQLDYERAGIAERLITISFSETLKSFFFKEELIMTFEEQIARATTSSGVGTS